MKTTLSTFITMLLSSFIFFQTTSYAESTVNILDELNPRDPQIEQILKFYDDEYFKATGESAIIGDGPLEKGSCYRINCPVWAVINKAEQQMHLYVKGVETYVWPVSTGKVGFVTPNMDQNPNGRVYDRYSSTIYPGGDYNGLGNMPYAVFVRGGYAIHGTTEGNWQYLGTPVSGGCIRLHPDNGFIFNRLVRANGVGSVWVTIQ